ncbi:MAG: hypothetical protein KKC75_02275 [Nanoarchaeota archaeon]|nr:hypothetical protein [Nanoarchaeota archaeon]MBU1005547.1 hypothetical protein [Nanoarchaeota archaeon]MBU1946606.1 hypothetical protein [Nanoarchaeota archaeon]
MKLQYLIPLFLVVLATTAIAASLDVSVNPSTAAPGSDLKLTLKTSGVPDGKWFVAYDVTLGGGCVRKENSQKAISDFMLDEVSADQTKEYNIKAPSADGICSVSVKYTYTGDSEKTASATATIKTPAAQPTSAAPPTPEPISQEPVEEKGGMSPLLIGGIIVLIAIIAAIIMMRKKK